MHHKAFITQLDERRIETAIAEAEKKTSGEIRVYISHKERHDAMEFAKRRFQELGMFKTKQRNAVLIYIVPLTQQFAVLGDAGIHEKCGDAFWTQVVADMAQRMKGSQFTDAIVEAVQQVGAALHRHFPDTHGDTNELSNKIARDQ